MKVLDPGHTYEVATLDGSQDNKITFVKRVGVKYPGNESAYPGTTLQEVLRVLIDRMQYVDNQSPSFSNLRVIDHLRRAIYLLEARAASQHNLSLPYEAQVTREIENLPVCIICGHIICEHM